MIRAFLSVSALAVVASTAIANDPCVKCGTPVVSNQGPKPACDNQIYPLSELKYIKRYCGPVISPNATYGYHATQWRQWDGGANATCAANSHATATSPGVTVTETKPTETKPVETKTAEPKTLPGKEIKPILPAPTPMNLPPAKELTPKPIEK